MTEISKTQQENLARLTADELLEVATVHAHEYEHGAVAFAREELERRGVTEITEEAYRGRREDSLRGEDAQRGLRLPRMWIGYVLAVVFVIAVAVEGALSNPERQELLFPWVAVLIGWGYWFVCVHRIHCVLARLTHGEHSVPPVWAILGHFLPIFNLYWIFAWTNAFARFVTLRCPSAPMLQVWPGLYLLFAGVLGRFDAGLGLLAVFALGSYLNSKLRRVLTETVPA